MIIGGLYAATWARAQPWNAWAQLGSTALWVTLLLAFATGDQITHDRTLRIDTVLLSTPVTTGAYVWGKYLAALVLLFGLALISLLTAVLVDGVSGWHSSHPFEAGVLFLGDAYFPSLGPRPYVAAWALLMTTPIIFGAALVLFTITLARGLRLLANILVLLFWVVPAFNRTWPDLFDVTAWRMVTHVNLGLLESNFRQGQASNERVVQLAVQQLPPQLPIIFLENRLLFLGISIILVFLTTALVGYRRTR